MGKALFYILRYRDQLDKILTQCINMIEVHIEYCKSGEKGHLLPSGGINEDL